MIRLEVVADHPRPEPYSGSSFFIYWSDAAGLDILWWKIIPMMRGEA